MDRRTTIALAACLLVFALFTVLQTKYAPKPKPAPPVAGAPNATGTPNAAAPGPAGTTPATTTTPATIAPAAPATPQVAEQKVVLETPLYRATFSNVGARLESCEL